MINNPDQAILARAKRFEAQALEEIFDAFSPGIYRYAYRLLGDEELAKECMSETFSRFLSALKRDRGPDTYLQAYLYRIAHNFITDYYRSKPPPTISWDGEDQSSPADDLDGPMVDQVTQRQLRHALTLLTPDQRQVIVLKYLEDWKNEGIAQSMNKPVSAVKALQHRGLEALHRILSKYEERYDQKQ
jgi:RNA polymerase sigma-70 factor (ECF subfamily)